MCKRRRKRFYPYIICFGLILIFIKLRLLIFKSCLFHEYEACPCFNLSLSAIQRNLKFLCSLRSVKRGPGQKVLSISVFGPVENPKIFPLNNSLRLLQEMINEIQHIYPDNWILRVYHDGELLDRTVVSHFEHHYNFVDFCDVTELQLSFIPPRMWRFLAAGDNLVKIMASRDLDSPLTHREKAAIDEWLLSNLPFHTMRDHPHHAAPMLAGMWAFRVENDRSFSYTFLSYLLDCSLIIRYALNTDQHFLAHYIWPYAIDKTLSHASYWCGIPQWNIYHRPFPTQRLTRNLSNECFVGCTKPCCMDWTFEKNDCPIECRPKEHQDWIYC